MTSDLQQPAVGAGAKGLRRYIGPKRLLLLAVYALVGGLAWHSWKNGNLSHQVVIDFIAGNPISAPLVFICTYAVVVVFMIPSLPLNLGAGYLWGPLLGSIYTTIGCTIGSAIAFQFARSAFGQPFTRSFDNNLLAWLSAKIAKSGWKVVAFVRINPAFPSGPINYLLGLTSVSLLDFLWATLVFPYPLSYGFAYLGYSVGGLVLDGDSQRLVQLVIAASFIFCVVFVGRLVYKSYLGTKL